MERLRENKEKREKAVSFFAKNGIFVHRDQLIFIRRVARNFYPKDGGRVFIENLGRELLNGVTTSDPNNIVAIRINGLNSLADWDTFWGYVLVERKNEERKKT